MKITDNVLLYDIDESKLSPLRQEIQNVLDKPNNYNQANQHLAGNLEKEYHLSQDTRNHLNDILMECINDYVEYHSDIHPNYLNSVDYCDRDYPMRLTDAWVNFQKKYEFNPVHRHTGLFSFVLWLQVPYTIEEEINGPHCVNSNYAAAGHFEIIYSTNCGEIITTKLPVDKTYEGKLLLFPSHMNHCVYPFYTSDEYRISVSGNIKICPHG